MYRFKIISISILTGIALVIFSQAAFSAKCGDPSPSVKEGVDPRTSIAPVELTHEDINKIQIIFESIAGKWIGTAEVSECIAKQGKDVMRQETNSVELVVEPEDKESITMEFELRSPEKGIRKNLIEKLYIDQNYLMFNDGPFNFKASVLYSRDNFLTYLRKTKLPGKGNIPVEFVRTVAAYSKDSLMIEDISYVNGRLSSYAVYKLK